MESGLSVTRMTSAIKGTHLNIYPEDDDVISLIAKQHNMRCRVYTILQRNAVNVGSSTENENVSFINGLKNYPNLMSIIAAPEECLCTKCLYTVVPPRHKIPSRDMFGFQRLTGLDSLKNAVRTQHGPSFPEYADKMTRVSNLMNHDPEVAGIIAEAGFFSGYRERENVCFYCGLSLCGDLLVDDPWREHARWFPVCPYLQKEKSEEFIHDVIYETKDLKRFYKGYDRPIEINMGMIESTLQEYSPIIIMETLQDFFQEVGSPPKPEEFFHILEIKKKWKTFENVSN